MKISTNIKITITYLPSGDGDQTDISDSPSEAAGEDKSKVDFSALWL